MVMILLSLRIINSFFDINQYIIRIELGYLHRTLTSVASSLLTPILFSARQTYVPVSFLWTGLNSKDSTNLRSSDDPSFLQKTLAGGLASAPHDRVTWAFPSSTMSSASLVMLTLGLSTWEDMFKMSLWLWPSR